MLRPQEGKVSMNAPSRRKYEMGVSAVEFNRGHPDTDPDYQLTAAELERLVALFRRE
jgi:hypothetical protein